MHASLNLREGWDKGSWALAVRVWRCKFLYALNTVCALWSVHLWSIYFYF